MASHKFSGLEAIQTIRARKRISNGVVCRVPTKYLVHQYERFINVKLNHRHLLLCLTPLELERFRVLETKFMDNFMKKNRKLFLVSIETFHKDFRLRALTQFHGCSFIDTFLITNIIPKDEVTDNCTLYRCLCCLRYHDKEHFR